MSCYIMKTKIKFTVMRILCGPWNTIKNNYKLLMALFNMNLAHSMRHSYQTTGWTTEEHFESQWGNRFLSSTAPRPVLWPIQPSIHCVPKMFPSVNIFRSVKVIIHLRLWRNQKCVELQYTSIPLSDFMTQCLIKQETSFYSI